MRILASKSRDPPTGPPARFHSLSYMGKEKKGTESNHRDRGGSSTLLRGSCLCTTAVARTTHTPSPMCLSIRNNYPVCKEFGFLPFHVAETKVERQKHVSKGHACRSRTHPLLCILEGCASSRFYPSMMVKANSRSSMESIAEKTSIHAVLINNGMRCMSEPIRTTGRTYVMENLVLIAP